MATFSVIVPAYDDEMATVRTLSNLIYQSGPPVTREVLVVADGPIKWVRSAVRLANQKALEAKQPIEFIYMHTSRHYGTGNIGRALALTKVKNDWVFFIDSGTVVLAHTFEMLHYALLDKPDADIIIWDVIQMVDPVPFIHFAFNFKPLLESEKIGYWITGVGAAIRKEIGQLEVWPNTNASDWAYWSAIWKRMTKPVKACLINSPLVIAYAGYDHKRYRDTKTPEYWHNLGYNLSYDESPYAHMIGPNPEV